MNVIRSSGGLDWSLRGSHLEHAPVLRRPRPEQGERMLSSRNWIGVFVMLLWLPAHAAAQSIAGVVRDTSGAVLPGVTVEASSPALIERTRSTVTDAVGQYRIVDLRPGIYTITFALQSFSTVRR